MNPFDGTAQGYASTDHMGILSFCDNPRLESLDYSERTWLVGRSMHCCSFLCAYTIYNAHIVYQMNVNNFLYVVALSNL